MSSSSPPSALKPILLVEDDPRDLELTLIALERSQLANEVIVVRDGAAALNYLMREGEHAHRTEGNPAVILLDLKLPKINGLEVLKHVRGTEPLKSIPVVMLTSSREERDLIRSYSLGVNAYVVKPVEFQKFLDAVRELVTSNAECGMRNAESGAALNSELRTPQSALEPFWKAGIDMVAALNAVLASDASSLADTDLRTKLRKVVADLLRNLDDSGG